MVSFLGSFFHSLSTSKGLGYLCSQCGHWYFCWLKLTPDQSTFPICRRGVSSKRDTSAPKGCPEKSARGLIRGSQTGFWFRTNFRLFRLVSEGFGAKEGCPGITESMPWLVGWVLNCFTKSSKCEHIPLYLRFGFLDFGHLLGTPF